MPEDSTRCRLSTESWLPTKWGKTSVTLDIEVFRVRVRDKQFRENVISEDGNVTGLNFLDQVSNAHSCSSK